MFDCVHIYTHFNTWMYMYVLVCLCVYYICALEDVTHAFRVYMYTHMEYILECVSLLPLAFLLREVLVYLAKQT